MWVVDRRDGAEIEARHRHMASATGYEARPHAEHVCEKDASASAVGGSWWAGRTGSASRRSTVAPDATVEPAVASPTRRGAAHGSQTA